ncbi:hypothetical protein OEZ85_009980 [Tetradesmus obliquus]|uniref:Uncharacterized protein n=1 Tax=Tetradesmus obliquus TaxID=3088 RepID=A0ABY8UAP4_TETOB|nr:hypothetical protein OEZ85_009980 [Tetradesmus obliquus]
MLYRAGALAPHPGSICRYKACCQPFVAGVSYPKSAPELVRARITAALAGKHEFLVASTHPDSFLALGGSRSLSSRAKRQCRAFRRIQCEVVGMAHCPGDDAGTWLVLAILQGTAEGDFKGVKTPYMELIARKSWREQQQQQQQQQPGFMEAAAPDRGDEAAAAAAAAAAAGGDDRWMFYKQTNQLPQDGDGDALLALLQQHVPELLTDAEGNGAEGAAAGQAGVMGRQVLFNWVTPCFRVSSSSSSSSSNGGGWYVDLLTPAVERLGAGAAAGSSSSSAQQQLLLLPPGVFRMDDYLEQR